MITINESNGIANLANLGEHSVLISLKKFPGNSVSSMAFLDSIFDLTIHKKKKLLLFDCREIAKLTTFFWGRLHNKKNADPTLKLVIFNAGIVITKVAEAMDIPVNQADVPAAINVFDDRAGESLWNLLLEHLDQESNRE